MSMEKEEEIIKKVNDIWEKEFKESFCNFMNQMQEEILNILKKKFNEIDKKLEEINNINESQNTNPLINVILQCLLNIKPLAMYYLNPTNKENILKKSKGNPNNTYLGPSFLSLLDHLWNNRKKYVPKEIHIVLKKLMLNNYNTNDAGIIINFILNKLNEELNLNQEYPNLEQDNPYDHFDADLTVKKLQDKFMKNRTQISDTFFSAIKIKKRCLKCKDYPQYFFEMWLIYI